MPDKTPRLHIDRSLYPTWTTQISF